MEWSDIMSVQHFQKRRQKYLDMVEVGSCTILFAGEAPHKTTDQYYPFTVNKSFFYLTGLAKQQFILVLLKGESKTFEFLFIEEASDYATKWLGKRMTKTEATQVSGIQESNIFFLDAFDGFLTNQVMAASRKALIRTPQTIYLDLYRHKPLAKSYGFQRMVDFLASYPECSVKNANQVIDALRMVKDAIEIQAMSQAIEYAKIGIHTLYQSVKVGQNERQLQALFQYTIQNAGSEGFSFNPIIASGAHATTLHYEENDSVIEDHSLVLCDLGTLHQEYASDITRTFPANKTFSARQKQLYQMVLDVNKACIEFVKPGIFMADLNQYAKSLLAKKALEIGLISDLTQIDRYYYHNVSHYLGLDVHDVGTYDQALKPGIVLTIEPGIYVEEEGIGIRIEDNVLVTETGQQNLSQAIIKEVDEIEQFMKS